MQYQFTAITESGTPTKGVLEAASVREAQEAILERGLIPQKVQKKGDLSDSSWGQRLQSVLGKVKPQELILFTKQFRTLFKAGVSVGILFQTMESQTENPKLKKAIRAMSEDIQEGTPLFEAFQAHPSIFSPLYVSMIRAGETSGSLTQVMNRLIYLLEHEFKIKNDVRSALQYPMIVLIALGVAFFVLLTFVIPKFVTIFESAGIDLPLPTLLAMNLYKFLSHFWLPLLGGTAGAVFLLTRFFKTRKGQLLRDRFFLKVPIIGPVLQKSAMSRFASIFAILQATGVTVLSSLEILSTTIGNAAVSFEFDKIRDHLTQGRGISAPLREAKYFTPMVVNMVAIGEESGNLEEMLSEISTHYDDEVAYAVSFMATNLGPVLVVGLAAVVGFFALAVFLPMWDLTQMVK